MTVVIPSIDPLFSPIKGSILIEASAGTGKTYTITALVLRSLLGINSRRIPLKNQLIVTFTRLATEELRKRIYEKIIELKEVILKERSDDDLMNAIISNLPISKKEALNLLLEATDDINDANIFTIHSFCQKILNDNPIATFTKFDTNISAEEEKRLRTETLKEFWRKNCYQFSENLTSYFLTLKLDKPQSLEPFFAVCDSLPQPISLPDMEEKINNLNRFYSKLKVSWFDSIDVLETEIKKAYPSKKTKWGNYFEKITLEFSKAPSFSEFNQNVFKKNLDLLLTEPHQNLDFILWNQLLDFQQEAINLEISTKNFISQLLNQYLLKRKQETGIIGFNDLLTNTLLFIRTANDTTLKSIRDSFELVMIDEFQDTDAVQYEIFSSLFASAKQHIFLMIGDPKQSIYRFRGADINTYLVAQQSVDYRYTLTTNYRSGDGVIKAVNEVFSQNSNPFKIDLLPFFSVDSAKNSEKQFLSVDDISQKGLIVSLYDNTQKQKKDSVYEKLSESMGYEIVNLLKHGSIHDNDKISPVKSKDITILVANKSEAQLVKKTLNYLNLPSVYLSEKENVYNTLSAKSILLLLKSLLDPTNTRLINLSFESFMYQISNHDLLRLKEDPTLYETLLLERNNLIKTWDKKGILPMLHEFLYQEDRLTKIRSMPSGEREATNLLHLTELLQKESLLHANKNGLVHWFENQCQKNSDNDDEETTTLRLEKEYDVIKILTIHKSKGLEFPIVFIPFFLYQSGKKDASTHDENEIFRLWYVALTRAKYLCWIGATSFFKYGNHKNSYPNVLTELYDTTDVFMPEALCHSKIIDCRIFTENKTMPEKFQNSLNHSVENTSVAIFNGLIDKKWKVTSFTNLSKNSTDTNNFNMLMDEPILIENNYTPSLKEAELDRFSFPKGNQTGTFFHALFEKKPSRTINQ